MAFDSSPAVVHDSVVQLIKDRLQMEMEDWAHSGNPLKKGERVLMAGSLLRDVEVVFDTRLTADDRVRVLLDLSRAYPGEAMVTR